MYVSINKKAPNVIKILTGVLRCCLVGTKEPSFKAAANTAPAVTPVVSKCCVGDYDDHQHHICHHHHHHHHQQYHPTSPQCIPFTDLSS